MSTGRSSCVSFALFFIMIVLFPDDGKWSEISFNFPLSPLRKGPPLWVHRGKAHANEKNSSIEREK